MAGKISIFGGCLAAIWMCGCSVDPDRGYFDSAPGTSSFGPGANDDSGTDEGPGEPSGDPSPGDGEPGADPGDGDGGEGEGTDGDTDEDGTKFDLAAYPDGAGETFGCELPEHSPCDAASTDPWHALGINCPGEYALAAQYSGAPKAMQVHEGPLGSHQPAAFPPLEGQRMVILSTGVAAQLTQPGVFASTAHVGYDPIDLPPPIVPNPVGGVDCNADPTLIGTGDCSNTVQVQWDQGNGAYDYAELRMTGYVPPGASGLAYDFAFFSTEYPTYYKTSFNDMYIAWLQSEAWTGNVSFDEAGSPISLNAGFLDYKDADNPFDCPAPCTAPELQGTAMEGHAGTKWLTTSAGVVAGEPFTLVFAIFDLSDDILDSVVILDNFRWNCEGGPPLTIPG